jgi:hypothetical protein
LRALLEHNRALLNLQTAQSDLGGSFRRQLHHFIDVELKNWPINLQPVDRWRNKIEWIESGA